MEKKEEVNNTKKTEKQEKTSNEITSQKVATILNKAKENGKITYGELANELVDINA